MNAIKPVSLLLNSVSVPSKFGAIQPELMEPFKQAVRSPKCRELGIEVIANGPGYNPNTGLIIFKDGSCFKVTGLNERGYVTLERENEQSHPYSMAILEKSFTLTPNSAQILKTLDLNG
jgi:hypothetical protein